MPTLLLIGMVLHICLGNNLGYTKQNNINMFTTQWLYVVVMFVLLIRLPLTKFRLTPLVLLFFALFVSLGISTYLLSAYKVSSLRSMEYHRLLSVALSVVMVFLLSQHAHVKQHFLRLVAYGVVASIWLIAICCAYLAQSGEVVDWIRKPPFFRNIRHAAWVYVMAWPLSIYLLAAARSRLIKIASLMSLALIASFLILSEARGGMIALGLSTLLLAPLAIIKLRFNIKVSLFYAACFVLLTGLISSGINAVFVKKSSPFDFQEIFMPSEAGQRHEGSLNQLSSGRMHLWTSSVEATAARNIWFGLGPEAFRTQIRKPYGFPEVQPHNTIVHWIVEWGVVGMLLIGLVLALFFLKGLRNIAQEKQFTFLMLQHVGLYGFISMNTLGLVDGVYYHATPLFFTMLSLALMLTHSKQSLYLKRRRESRA